MYSYLHFPFTLSLWNQPPIHLHLSYFNSLLDPVRYRYRTQLKSGATSQGCPFLWRLHISPFQITGKNDFLKALRAKASRSWKKMGWWLHSLWARYVLERVSRWSSRWATKISVNRAMTETNQTIAGKRVMKPLWANSSLKNILEDTCMGKCLFAAYLILCNREEK